MLGCLFVEVGGVLLCVTGMELIAGSSLQHSCPGGVD